MLYTLRRAPELIDATTPDAYFRSWLPMSDNWSTHLDASLDLASAMAYPPPGGWPAPQPGASNPLEGTWYFEYKPFTNLGWASSLTRSLSSA